MPKAALRFYYKIPFFFFVAVEHYFYKTYVIRAEHKILITLFPFYRTGEGWWCSNRGSLVSHEISSCFLFLSGIEWKRKYLCITCIKASFAPQISGFIYINTMIYSILLTVGPDQNSLQAIVLP